MLDSCKMLQKQMWSIPYVSVVSFFQSLKLNFIAYRSFKVSSRADCIFEIHLSCQSGFSRVCSNCNCSCSFEPEIIKISQSSHKIYNNGTLNFQESTTILNACTKKLVETYWMYHVLVLCIFSIVFMHAWFCCIPYTDTFLPLFIIIIIADFSMVIPIHVSYLYVS